MFSQLPSTRSSGLAYAVPLDREGLGVAIKGFDGADDARIAVPVNAATPGVKTIAWSEDGRKLALLWEERFGDAGIVTVGADGTGAKVVAHERTRFLLLSQPVWAEDDKRIYFTRRETFDGSTHLLVADSGEGQARTVVDSGEGLSVTSLQLSPAGDTLLLVSSHSWTGNRLHLVSTEGTSFRELAVGDDGGVWVVAAAWSPDGSRIATLFYGPDARLVLYTTSPDGTDQRILLERAAGGEIMPSGTTKPTTKNQGK